MVYNLYDKLVLNDHKKSAIDLDVVRSQGEGLITNWCFKTFYSFSKSNTLTLDPPWCLNLKELFVYIIQVFKFAIIHVDN